MQVENWLKLQWLSNQDKEQLYDATVVFVNPFSITVRLDNTGIEGTVELRKKGEQWTFDSKTMSQSDGTTHLHLGRSEEHTSELQSRPHLVCRLLLEKKKNQSLKLLQLAQPLILIPRHALLAPSLLTH